MENVNVRQLAGTHQQVRSVVGRVLLKKVIVTQHAEQQEQKVAVPLTPHTVVTATMYIGMILAVHGKKRNKNVDLMDVVAEVVLLEELGYKLVKNGYLLVRDAIVLAPLVHVLQ